MRGQIYPGIQQNIGMAIEEAKRIVSEHAIAKYVPFSMFTEQGDLIYASAVATSAALAHANAGDLFQSGGHAADPSWIARVLIDHGDWGGQTHDDHSIYALLAGRAGGQTLFGGTGAGNNLSFESTSDPTKGWVEVLCSTEVGFRVTAKTKNEFAVLAIQASNVPGENWPASSSNAILRFFDGDTLASAFGANVGNLIQSRYCGWSMYSDRDGNRLGFGIFTTDSIGSLHSNFAWCGFFIAGGQAAGTAGPVGIGGNFSPTNKPTARLHLAAGSATAETAPLKFTSGPLNTTAEAGAVEFLTNAFYGTITTGAARKTFAFLESPTFVTQITAPVIIGGTGVTDILGLQGTSGNGTLTSPAIQALVGNDGATVAWTVLNNGKFGIGTTAPPDTFTVLRGVGTLQTAYPSAAHFEHITTDSATARQEALFVWCEGNPSANSATAFRTIEGDAIITAGNTKVLTGELTGLFFQSLYRGDSPGSLDELYGVRITAGLQRSGSLGGSGTIENIYGFRTNTGTFGAGAVGTVANCYDIYIPDNAFIAGSTIQNAYGLYIAGKTKGSVLNYSLYVAGGVSYFEGNVGIGATAFDASAAKTLALANATAPAAHTDDQIYIYSADTSDATATLGLYLEQAVEDIGTFTASHKFKILLNGDEYWLQLDKVAA